MPPAVKRQKPQAGQGAEKLWRVRLGPEPDRAGTEKLRDQAKQKLTITGMIVTVP